MTHPGPPDDFDFFDGAPSAAEPVSASNDMQESMWIDVFRQMDVVYSDLVASQTKLEEKHDELVETHQLINSVFDAMTDVVVACDRSGRIERVNAAFTQIVGAHQDSLVGSDVPSLFVEVHQDQIEQAIKSARSGQKADQIQLDLVDSDGGKATISTTITPRHDRAGEVIGLVLVGRPLGELQRAYRELDAAHSDLKRTQEKLLLNEKMAAMGRLVAGVAHELNNPISFVFGNMYSLRRYGEILTQFLEQTSGQESPNSAALRQELNVDAILADIGPLVDGTLEGAERVRDIVQDLRRFSATQREEPEQFDLLRVLRTATGWVTKAQREPPEIVIDAPDTLEISTLKGQLHQIIVNLVQNACDAVHERKGARVHIAVSRSGKGVRIRVADNGPGIAPEDQLKIFEPFYTTKPIGTGTGLGLYVSYSIAAKMDGHLAYSDARGGGACFTLTVPDAPKVDPE